MPPILPSGKYTISFPTPTETYCIGPLKDNPDKIGILPGDVGPRPIYTLDNVDGVDEYNISIDGRSVTEKGGGEICLELPEVNVGKKWKIVRSCDGGYQIKGDPGEGTCWYYPSVLPQNLDGFQFSIQVVLTCPKCPTDCACSPGNKCVHVGCTGCITATPTGPDGGCSGCPSPCSSFLITRITE